MKRKNSQPQPAALELFEARKVSIAKKAAQIAALLETYDRAISSTMGGHQDYSHAGTLGHVDALLEQARLSLADAIHATSKRGAK